MDIKLIREKPDAVRENLEKRGAEDKIPLLDELIDIDQQWRQNLEDVNALKYERNELSHAMAEFKKGFDMVRIKRGQETINKQHAIKRISEIPKEINEIDTLTKDIKQKADSLLAELPNLLHPDAPIGKDESENVEIRTWGTPRQFDFPVKNHVEIMDDLGLADFESSAKTSGTGFYFLKGDLALLSQALIQFAIEHMLDKGYVYVEPPLMVYKDVLTAALDMEGFEQSIYKVDTDDLCLIGTSEYSLLGMHTDEVIQESQLPKKYFAYTMCFRKEIGSHGINERGLWRTHQFNKVEQFVFCLPEDSDRYYDEMMQISEEIYEKLGLPYRIFESCSGDLAMWKSRGSDIEIWRPTTNDYGELCSLSNCTDYQARNLGIRTIKNDGTRVALHTLNNTVIATSRTMVAILENYQNADGSVTIPEPLRKFMGDKDTITKS